MMKNDRLLSDIARERIFKLVELAKKRTKIVGTSDELSKKYLNIAKSIKMRHGLRDTNTEIKKVLCKTCGSVVIPGFNATVRMSSQNKYRVVICSRCGTEKHLFYK